MLVSSLFQHPPPPDGQAPRERGGRDTACSVFGMCPPSSKYALQRPTGNRALAFCALFALRHTLVSGATDRSRRIWDVASGRKRPNWSDTPTPSPARWSADGESSLSGMPRRGVSRAGGVFGSQKQLARLDGRAGPVAEASLSLHDGRTARITGVQSDHKRPLMESA